MYKLNLDPGSRVRVLKSLTLLAAILAFALVVVGNIVRVTNSGLGCPDWPLCYGNVLPVLRSDAIIEVAHRVFAALVSVLVVVIAIMNMRWKTSLARLSAVSLGLLAVQIILGALTVWLQLQALIVALHLVTGMALLGCMVAMAVLLRTEEQLQRTLQARSYGRAAATTAAAIFVLLFTGGLVSGNGAALACNMSFRCAMANCCPTAVRWC